VEDVVRDMTIALAELPGVTWLSAECESHESIHNHNALAQAELTLPSAPSNKSLTQRSEPIAYSLDLG